MTPDERQLIADLFERMRSVGDIDKDREAEGFIAQQIMATPDAAYKLVQTVFDAREYPAGRAGADR